MNKVKVELNSAGVQALLKSAEMAGLCKAEADAIAKKCGAGYESDSYVGKTRVNAMVFPVSSAAQEDNSENNTLLRAL